MDDGGQFTLGAISGIPAAAVASVPKGMLAVLMHRDCSGDTSLEDVFFCPGQDVFNRSETVWDSSAGLPMNS